MRLALSCALLASALLGLSACNKAESPKAESAEKVQADVAKAKSDAVEENAKADEKQKQVEAEAAKERADAEAKAADKKVGALVDSAVTQAEGATKVALAKGVPRQGKRPYGCSKKEGENCQVRLSGLRRRISSAAAVKCYHSITAGSRPAAGPLFLCSEVRIVSGGRPGAPGGWSTRWSACQG
jgi:hypothetical protein